MRIAKKIDPVKLKDLRIKINDQKYLQGAIDLIAIKLTNEIVNRTWVKN